MLLTLVNNDFWVILTESSDKIAYNGKSIGEERATLHTFSKKTILEQKFFPLTKIQKSS